MDIYKRMAVFGMGEVPLVMAGYGSGEDSDALTERVNGQAAQGLGVAR